MGNRQGAGAQAPFAPASGPNSLENFIRERAMKRVNSQTPPQKPPPPLDDPEKVDKLVMDSIAGSLSGVCEGASEVNLVVVAASGLGGKAFCRFLEDAYQHAFVFVDPTRNPDEDVARASAAALSDFDKMAFERHALTLIAYGQKLLYGWQSAQGSMWNPPNRIRVFYKSARDSAIGAISASASMRAMPPAQAVILRRMLDTVASFEAAHVRPDRTLHVYLERACLRGEYTALCKNRGALRRELRGAALDAYVEHRCAAKTLLDAYYTSPAVLQDPTKLTIQIDEQFVSEDRYRRLVLYESIRTLAHLMDAGLWRNEKRGTAQTLPLVVNQHLNLCAWYGKSSEGMEAERARADRERAAEVEVRPAPAFTEVPLHNESK